MQRLGRYEIVGELGKGGMGIVYEAVDAAIGRHVAIKTIYISDHGSPAEAAGLVERLQREARAAGGLKHPNIVTVHDLGQDGDVTYIVMELVQGQTLEQLLAGEARVPPPSATKLVHPQTLAENRPVAAATLGRADEILRILASAAAALDYAHANGIVHRDIKPANIMIQNDGLVKIADFGIAKLPMLKTMTTEGGALIGTPHFMAPEQLKAEPVTGKTDQFSLATAAYYALTGQRPFNGDSMATLVGCILYQEPAPVHTLNSFLLPSMQQVFARAMAKNPADRFGTCSEFIAALQAAMHPERAPMAAPPPPPPPAKSSGLSMAVVAGVVLLIVVLAAGGFYFFRQHQANSAEIAFWDSVRQSKDQGLYEQYLSRYPDGKFVSVAIAELDRIKAASPPPEPPPAQPVVPPPKQEPAAPPAAEPVKTAAPKEAPPAPKPAPPEPPKQEPAVRFTAGSRPGEVRQNPLDGLNYSWIPAGKFEMGCSPADTDCYDVEKPRHSVTITKGFWIGQTEVTVGAYRRFTKATGKPMPPAPPINPNWAGETQGMGNITWQEAADYCRWTGGRLPTEAEWEYAARAGSVTARYGRPLVIAWTALDKQDGPADVAKKMPNSFGLYDVIGNLSEWTGDWFRAGYYNISPSADPQGPATGVGRSARGGSRNFTAKVLRVSGRLAVPPDTRRGLLGCRCLKPAE